MNSYNQTYAEAQHVFGRDHEPILEMHASQINLPLPVLDVGAGQGRNSFFTARQGIPTHALDPSEVAIEEIKRVAMQQGLPVVTYCSEFSDFDCTGKTYSAIMFFGLLQILSPEDKAILIKKTDQLSKKGSLIFITAFSTLDDSFSLYRGKWSEVGPNHFSDGKGNYRFFLGPKEILSLFKGYQCLHHWEGLGPWHQHGQSKHERHSMVEAVLLKK